MISAICNKNELKIQEMSGLACVGCAGCASTSKNTPSGVETTVQKLTRCFTRNKNDVLRGKEIWRLKLIRGQYSHAEHTFLLRVWSTYRDNSMFDPQRSWMAININKNCPELGVLSGIFAGPCSAPDSAPTVEPLLAHDIVTLSFQ